MMVSCDFLNFTFMKNMKQLSRTFFYPALLATLSAISALSSLTHSISLAQSPGRLAEIPAKFEAFVVSNDIAGALTVVGDKNSVLHFHTVGLANRETNSAMQKNSLFRVASMTKPMTALAIMILQDEGKLNVNDAVEKYLPEFKDQMQIVSKSKLENNQQTITLKKTKPITIHQLLTHTSGLSGSYPTGVSDVYQKRNRTLAETTLAISQKPLEFEPGSKWSYCNPGIDTCGRIVEVVSGMKYEQFMKTRIFDPLGMTDTTFYPNAEQRSRIATAYYKEGNELKIATNLIVELPENPQHPIPAGGLYSNGNDLPKLYQMMLNKGKHQGIQIVSEAAVKQMTSLQTGEIKCGFVDEMGFGYGWAYVRKPTGVTENLSVGTFGHGGALGTQAWVDPVKNRYYILLIQMNKLPNADASPMRKTLQELGSPN